MLYFRNLRIVLNLVSFEKLYNFALFREHFHKYFEMLLHAKLLNLKTFKDFSFMPKSKTFKDIWKELFFLKTSIKIVT